MKTEIKSLLGIAIILIFTACSGGDDDGPSGPGPQPENTAPTRVSQLIFPSSNLLCTDNVITFEWSASTDAEGDPITYRLVVATDRDLTNVVEQRNVSSTNITVSLDEGVAYYWAVTARDNKGAEADPSPTFAFYTEGSGVSNHAPFTAALNSPLNGETVSTTFVNLNWSGGDADDGDVLTYDIYFGDSENPPLFQAGWTLENLDVTTNPATTYYWRVDTIDDSGVKTIGQLWTFETE